MRHFVTPKTECHILFEWPLIGLDRAWIGATSVYSALQSMASLEFYLHAMSKTGVVQILLCFLFLKPFRKHLKLKEKKTGKVK